MQRAGGAAERERAELIRRVAPRVETARWAWMRGYISDAQFDRLIVALAREIADRIAPPARADPGTEAPRPVGSR